MMKAHNVLWTGGWDSSFRVIDLALLKGRTVQPYYVMGTGRKSATMEEEARESIKEMIGQIDKGARDRILNTKVIDKSKVPFDDEIDAKFRALRNREVLGKQYNWLARCMKRYGLNDIELCVHEDDLAHNFIKQHIEKVEDGNDHTFKLKSNYSDPNLSIFSYFNFPLLNYTKLEMAEIAKENGFDHIMEKTWFCHMPVKGKPCGMCGPCRYTKEEGLGRRVPEPTLYMRLMRGFEDKIDIIKENARRRKLKKL